MSKLLSSFTLIAALLFAVSCGGNSSQVLNDTPSWFVNPKQNDSENIYGIAQGQTLEEATKYALADAASKLMVSVSSDSTLIREENRYDANEEMRQKVRQNIEKISFTNFEINQSTKTPNSFFVEVKIDRNSFIQQQKEQFELSERKVANLDKNSANTNALNRRDALLKISALIKELELKGRIIEGAGENIGLQNKLVKLETFNNELEKTTDKIEFFFDANSEKQEYDKSYRELNKEKIKVVTSNNPNNQNQVTLKISSKSHSQKIYDYTTKIEVDFSNLIAGKVIASNSIEASGNSVIGEKESYKAALKSLEEQIAKNGVLKTIGILN